MARRREVGNSARQPVQQYDDVALGVRPEVEIAGAPFREFPVDADSAAAVRAPALAGLLTEVVLELKRIRFLLQVVSGQSVDEDDMPPGM
jgi:hypothetical protein